MREGKQTIVELSLYARICPPGNLSWPIRSLRSPLLDERELKRH